MNLEKGLSFEEILTEAELREEVAMLEREMALEAAEAEESCRSEMGFTEKDLEMTGLFDALENDFDPSSALGFQ